MSSCFYSKTVNLYPRALALERLPVGIPAGQLFHLLVGPVQFSRFLHS